MERDYIRHHLKVLAGVYAKRPLPDNILDIIVEKLYAHPRIQQESVAAREFALGQGCRFYVEEVNRLIGEPTQEYWGDSSS